jgi:hypothetical protein
VAAVVVVVVVEIEWYQYGGSELKRYTISWKIAGSISDEIILF